MCPNFDPKSSKYSDAHMDVMEQVLDVWKVFDEEEKFKVLHDYLCDVDTNTHGLYESTEDYVTELRILKRIDRTLDADEHEYLLASHSADIGLYRAEKRLFKVKATMLDFLKSQMKAATMLDFVKSLAALPEEYSQLKDATMLDCLESLVDLDLSEARKNFLLQKVVGGDFTSAYDEARKSSEEHEESEKCYIDLLQELGVEYLEENSTDDEYTCADMDSFKKRLEVMEDEVEEKLENVQRVNESRNLDCVRYGREVKFFIQHLDKCVNQRVCQAEK
ncbi:hypothetical protein MKW92_030812 [Papaver armeniacum]|nr:hypothetical protein MKW92_030812 [Papaver armeniacum]